MAQQNALETHFWFDGVERPITNVTYDLDYQPEDASSTATSGDGTDTTTKRPKSTSSITYDLRDALGAEISSGTLTAGQVYQVTAVDTELAAYAVGELFTADGTETMSADDKVKPLGAKLHAENMSISIASSTSYPVTDLTFNETYGEDDASSTSTGADAYESTYKRAARTCDITIIMDSAAADILVNSAPANKAIVITLASGNTITGNGIFVKKSNDLNARDGGLIKTQYTINWQGTPVSTLNLLTPKLSKAVKRIAKIGSSTNKEQTGNGIIFTTSFTASPMSGGLIPVTQTMTWQGSVTDAVAN